MVDVAIQKEEQCLSQRTMRDKHQQPHAGAVHKTERAPALAQHGTARPGEPHYQGCLVELVPKPFNVVVHEQKLGRHPKKTKQGVKRTENILKTHPEIQPGRYQRFLEGIHGS